ncbi:MAG TPA: C2 family cysteine protease, partial [Roseiarcus sp.]|nr:C2 family cysteine protease [Roseiarcus sp.]
TEAEMTKALTDLAGELTSSKTTLSSSQLSDLKTIAANIGSMGASSYLQFVTNALVNGNAANATWTGGASQSVALGNLAAGETVAKLDELIGKWFQGTDLPSSKVSMSGYPSFTVSYSAVSSPLFGANGPSMSDVNQGYLGDCYLLSSLAEVANQDPSAITSMITNNGNGTYGVRFYVDGQARYVTVDAQLADGGRIFNSGSNIWASLVEEAYAELQTQGVCTGNSVNAGDSFSTIGNGGAPEFALEEITGASAITDFYASSSGWLSYTYNQSFTAVTASSNPSAATALSTLAADLAVGDDLVLCSYTSATDSSGKTTLVGDHAMSIYGYDAATGMLEIRNPWGTEAGQTWDTTFEVSLKTLLSDGDTITADNAGTATTVSGASVVAAAGLQAIAQVTSFSVTDSVANVDSGLAALIADTKLTSLTVTGTAGADALTLTGFKAAATVNMGGDSDKATVAGFASTGSGAGKATSLNLGSGYDTVALGSGADTIDFALGASGGVEDVAAFNSAHDMLSVALNGGALEQTLVSGGDWISSSTDLTHGVFLAGVTSLQRVTVSGGTATVA